MSYLGIDLGTTNSVAVIYDDKTDEIQIVKTDGVEEILPSVVNYSEEGVLVGQEAKEGAIIYPETTIASVKKLMGDTEPVVLGEFSKLPEEISADILLSLKLAAEEQAGKEFNEVVITHPAYFNDRQIYATKQAGLLAGFKDVYLMSEPLAAAIEYGYKQGYAQTIMVYDLGGGTFDVCVLKVSRDAYGQEVFQELSDVGDMNLGGDNFDALLIKFFKEKFREEHNIDLDELDTFSRLQVNQKLKYEAESIKKRLSVSHTASAKVSPLIIADGVPLSLNVEIAREEFEAMLRPYVDRSKEIIEEALARAVKSPDEISKVILVGGSTLIPMVKRMVAGFIKEPYMATDPAKSVAMGAAIYNYLIHLPGSNVSVGQVTRHILGTQAIIDLDSMEKGLIPIIPIGTAIPCSVSDANFATMQGASSVNVDLYQWDAGYEDDKKYIGSVSLKGLEGSGRVELTYALDENNIFEVYVRDLKSGIAEKGVFDRTKEMPPPEKSESLEYVDNVRVVFIIDTTGSMDTYINGVKDRAIEFAGLLQSKGAEFELGLIGFGDLGEKEKPKVYDFTNDVEKFQNQVKMLPKYYGGDIPESSLDALETGIALLNSKTEYEGDKNIFILITDAPPHVPTANGRYIEDIRDMLERRGVTTYVAAKKDKESLEAYTPLIETGGKYYDLKDKFYDILDNIALSIAELIRL
ncbi:MAG: Hsp70 family protein [Defluviitaleaceae bacterium]|nr:Hsp70 family protein [Defluviitaleaceae bacterium]